MRQKLLPTTAPPGLMIVFPFTSSLFFCPFLFGPRVVQLWTPCHSPSCLLTAVSILPQSPVCRAAPFASCSTSPREELPYAWPASRGHTTYLTWGSAFWVRMSGQGNVHLSLPAPSGSSSWFLSGLQPKSSL